MARKATGKVIEHEGTDGRTYRALRFTAVRPAPIRLARRLSPVTPSARCVTRWRTWNADVATAYRGRAAAGT